MGRFMAGVFAVAVTYWLWETDRLVPAWHAVQALAGWVSDR